MIQKWVIWSLIVHMTYMSLTMMVAHLQMLTLKMTGTQGDFFSHLNLNIMSQGEQSVSSSIVFLFIWF